MSEKLGRDIARLALGFDEYECPIEVMDALDRIVFDNLEINCVGYMVVPSDWRKAVSDPKSYYVPHSSVAEGWVDDWSEATSNDTDLGIVHALTQPCPTTDTELLQLLNPTGSERRAIEVKYNHGARDRLIMQVMSSRMLFGYWSRKRMELDVCDRVFLHVGAHLVACKHLRVNGLDYTDGTVLTNRELACLRLASVGMEQAEAARALGVAATTCKDYFASARKKLGAKTTAGAVASALRKKLIT